MREVGARNDQRLTILQDFRQGAAKPPAGGRVVGANDDRDDLHAGKHVLDERHLDLDRMLLHMRGLVIDAVRVLADQSLSHGAVDVSDAERRAKAGTGKQGDAVEPGSRVVHADDDDDVVPVRGSLAKCVGRNLGGVHVACVRDHHRDRPFRLWGKGTAQERLEGLLQRGGVRRVELARHGRLADGSLTAAARLRRREAAKAETGGQEHQASSEEHVDSSIRPVHLMPTPLR